mmetsp:Transcript_27015/g.55360  ORF Transcript_27015/g.55360 Transcript_27015/m.55360 type:complete len:674 (+) Transcript_27015:413-2434(+)
MSLQIGDKICISGFVTCAACTTSATVLPPPQYTSFQCLLDSTCPTNYEILAKSQEGSFCRAFRLDDAGSERLWSAGVAYDVDGGRDDGSWGQVFPVSFRGSILDWGDEFTPATVDVDFSDLEFEMGGCEYSTVPVFCLDSVSADGGSEGDNSGLQDEVDDAFIAEIFVDDLSFPVTTSPSTDERSKKPSDIPTESPSTKPTEFPKIKTSISPTEEPSIKLTTEIPPFLLSRTPTEAPSRKPTKNPSKSPTEAPSFGSISIPIRKPSMKPTVEPTLLVTKAPSQAPTRTPSTGPTETSTGTPSLNPNSASSMGPSSSLSESPTLLPRSISFDNPTFASSTNGTLIPSNKTDTNSTATTLTMFNDKYSPTYFPTCTPSENATIPEESIESPEDNDYTLKTDNNDTNGTIPTTISKVTGNDAYTLTSQQNEVKRLFSTHGKIAGITWGVLLPLAVAVPWLRDIFPSPLTSKNGVGVSGTSNWLVIHMGLTIISAVLTSVALYLAIKALTIEGGFEYAEKFFAGSIHKSLGLFLSIGIWVQVLGGIFRPSKISDLSDGSTKGSSDENQVEDVAYDVEEGIEAHNHSFSDNETNSQQNNEFVMESGPPRSRRIWGFVHRLLALWLIVSGMWQVTSGFNAFESRYGKESVIDILELWYLFWIGIYWFVVLVLTYFYKQF